MLNLNQLTNYELIDVSKYKTDRIIETPTAQLYKYGKLVFINIECKISNDSESKRLFENLPYKPIYLTELYSYADKNRTRAMAFTGGYVAVYEAYQEQHIYISGVYFTDD